MEPNQIIDYERSLGRRDEEILRRLYMTENPFSLRDKEQTYFDICNTISNFFNIPIHHIRAAGSGQTGYSFHQNRNFQPKNSDFDVAVVNGDIFEKYLRAVQRVALPNPKTLQKPDRHVFPMKRDESYYNEFMTNVAFFGVLMPYQMPSCAEKNDLMRMTAKLSEKYAEEFESVNIAIYLSGDFFMRKQHPNLGFYDNLVQR